MNQIGDIASSGQITIPKSGTSSFWDIPHTIFREVFVR
jgi:hypothetical protein